MTRRLLPSLGLLLLSLPAFAQITPVPSLMNFQGRLTRPDGTPVTNGSYTVRFSFWTAATSGTEKWNQTVSALAVRNGTFAVLFSNFPASTFDGNLWLEIKIGSDAPLAPRQPLVSAAYAFKANSVPDGTISSAALADGAVTTTKLTDGSITPSKLASNTLNNLAWLLGGNSATNPTSQFLGTKDNQPLSFRTNNVERMRLQANGNVGINTNDPSHRLTIASPDANTLRLIGPDGEFGWGARLNFGDNDYVYLKEDVDDSLTIHSEGRLAITSGNVGIGTTSPARALHVQSGGYGLMVGSSATGGTNVQFGISGGRPAIQGVQVEGTTYGILRINPEGGQVTIGAQTFNNVVFNVANTARYAIGTDGTVIAGDYVNDSDASLKTDVHPVGNALGSILALDGVTFHWNEAARKTYNLPATRRFGFIAQDVERVLPDLVMIGPKGTKAVSYIGVVPVLVEAVKTLNAKVEQRDAEVADLKAQVATLTEAVKQLQSEHQK